MPMVPFDLSKLSESLEGQNTHKQLRNLIKRFSSASSILRDLRIVRTSLEQLIKIDEQGTSEGSYVLCSALLVQAVISYSRAAHSDSEGRFKMGVENAYDAKQKSAHKDVIKLRDEIIAHYGIGTGTHSAHWRIEKAVLRLDDHRMGIGAYWGATNFSDRVVTELLDLVTAAIPHMENIRDKQLDQLLQAVHDEMNEDPAFFQLLLGFVFDYKTFFGPGFEAEIAAFERGEASRTDGVNQLPEDVAKSFI